MNIALSTDHAGFEQLKQLKVYLESLGHNCQDYGPKQLDPTDDYPDFIVLAAQAVANDRADVGIIWGGSGQGEAMVANKISSVRCAIYYSAAVAKGAIDADGTLGADEFEILRLSRQHNHANMLSLGARFLEFEDVKRAVAIWLETPYSNADRHIRRVNKMDEL